MSGARRTGSLGAWFARLWSHILLFGYALESLDMDAAQRRRKHEPWE